MLTLSKIAVTGPFGAGKSTVCLVLRALGAFVADADLIVKQLMVPSTPLGKQIIKLLGKDILEHETIDRMKLAEKVFTEPEKLRLLEQLIHPYVFKEIEELYENVKKQNHYRFFVVEMPLLFELEKQGDYDYIITVVTDSKNCKERLKKRGYGPEEYDKRMKRFSLTKEKKEKSHFIIDNNGTFEDLRKKVEEITYQISKSSH